MPDSLIIEKTLNNEATEEEAREVVRWFATPEGQSWLSARMDQDERLISLGEEMEWMDHEIPSRIMYERIMRQLRRQRIRRIVAYAAAVLIPMALALTLFVQVNSRVNLLADDKYEEIYVPNGERMQVLSQDGSKAFLNAGSRLRYPRQFTLSERKVYLEGEAWFEIEKSRRPFIVGLSDFDVSVLGTTFDVKAYPDEEAVVVTLETGTIRLESAYFQTHRLTPGETAVYDKRSRRCEVQYCPGIERYSAWRHNVLYFKDTPLDEVIRMLTRKYDKSFVVKDPAALRYSYTITMIGADLPAVLEDLEKITPVRFVENGEMIEIWMRE